MKTYYIRNVAKAAQTVKKGMRFVSRFGSEYQVVRVIRRSGKATVMRMKSGSTSNWPISEVESELVKEKEAV